MSRRPNRRTSVAALDLEKIEDLAAKGLTLEQIAAALSIDVRTLYNHRKKFREVGEAINRGAANGIAMIANKLFEAANNGNVTAQIFFLKARSGRPGGRSEPDPRGDPDTAQSWRAGRGRTGRDGVPQAARSRRVQIISPNG
jgi:hypothetical protein